MNQSVKQGCILSPWLFNIFLSDLPDILDSTLNEINPNPDHPSCLLWANDIIPFPNEGLKKMLKSMEEYCKENELILNTEKTKCMIFNRTDRLIREMKAFFNLKTSMGKYFDRNIELTLKLLDTPNRQ